MNAGSRRQVAGVGEGSGRHDPHDRSLDDALRLLRVLDLLADGDAESLLHEPRDVAVGGVVRHCRTIGMALPLASFERDVSVSSRARAAVSASSKKHLVEVANAEEVPMACRELPLPSRY